MSAAAAATAAAAAAAEAAAGPQTLAAACGDAQVAYLAAVLACFQALHSAAGGANVAVIAGPPPAAPAAATHCSLLRAVAVDPLPLPGAGDGSASPLDTAVLRAIAQVAAADRTVSAETEAATVAAAVASAGDKRARADCAAAPAAVVAAGDERRRQGLEAAGVHVARTALAGAGVGIATPAAIADDAGAARALPRDGYLCTGLDAFVWHECDAFEAMALLHSRVARVFFVTPSPHDGALASALRLHTLRTINHRYEVCHLVPPPAPS